MKIHSKPGRPAKVQLRCYICRESCLPKNGDWFYNKQSDSQQVFLCRTCEQQTKSDFKKAVQGR